ncbi:MAG: sensor histidine kinase [Chloroflexi bacterium]|nr:sensor histidine kinase [Chloroflexota bacterium]
MNRSASDAPPLASALQRLWGSVTRRSRAADAALSVAVFVTTLFFGFDGSDAGLVMDAPGGRPWTVTRVGDVPFAAALVLLALACASLHWRRSQPFAVLWVTVIATALAGGIGYSHVAGGLAMLVALYSVGRHASSDLWSYIGLGGASAVFGLDYLFGELTAAAVGFGLVVMSMAWYIGTRVRMRAEQAAQLERERASDADRAVAEERTRIARELHDVVAHRVSLMTVQAGAAKTVAGDDPQAALQAMEAVEHAGREALEELRHLLGVLRPKADGGSLGPQPGLADVPRLVDQFKEAGLDVSLTKIDVPTDLPTRVDLSAYRIVQEALTNVLKHAGPGAWTEVRVNLDNEVVSIEVTDDGHAVTTLPGSGHGIMGMRERAQLLGGSLTAGPRVDGGFRVMARLPIGGGAG